MEPNGVGDIVFRIQKLIQAWGWSLAMGATLELRDQSDGFVMTGSVQDIAHTVRDEARYRAVVAQGGA